MRSRWSIFVGVLAIGLVALAIWGFRNGGDQRLIGAGKSPVERGTSARELRSAEPSAESRDDTPQDQVSGPAASPVPSVQADPALVAAQHIGPAGGVEDAPRVEVKRVLTEQWLDPERKASRRRVRIVEADFKYPLLRVEDEVTRLPDGSETVVFRQAEVADHLMVGLKNGADEIKERLKDAGWHIRGQGKDSYLLVEVANAADPQALPDAVAKLRQDLPEAAYIESDPILWALVTPNDPRFGSGSLWGLHNPGGRSGYAADADIDAPEAWDLMHDAPNTVVAVIDTGIRYTHEDLADNIWTNPTEIPSNGLDDDGNGVIDDIHGYDAANADGDPMDDQGHGTHCAGTVGAVGNNGKGITGVAWNVKLMGVKFLTASGSGTTSDAILCVDYARLNGANVISASWGGGPYHSGLFAAIRACGNAGIPFVAAAGNDSANNDAIPHYPSSYDLPNVIAVAATGPNDQLASFSCYGKNSVDIAAPGVDIVSTYHTSDQAYKSLNGTSMATPHVSGMLALARARFPQDKDYELIKRLLNSADVVPSLANYFGKGQRANLRGLLASSSASGVPSNDRLVTAERLYGTDVSWTGSNAGATRDPGENAYNPATGARSVWLSWQALANGVADLTVDADPQGQGLRVVVFKMVSTSAFVAVADSTITAEQSGTARLRFNVSAGSDHRIAITSDTEDGQFLSLGLTLRPPNDNVADATELTGERFAANGTTFGATAEPFEIITPHAGSGAGKSVWWKWTAPFTGPFVLTTEGSEFDTVLAVYQPGSGENPPMEVASNDDAGPLDGSSALEFNANAGVTYLFAVDSYRIDSKGACKLNGFRPGPPQILSQPADVEVPLDRRAVFNVSAGGALRLQYQWFKDGVALPGETSRTLVIDPVRRQDFGGYSVEVSNGRESTTSRTAQLKEKLLPPKFTWTSGNQAVEAGGTIDLRVQLSGSLPMTYQWSKGGAVIEGQTDSYFTLENVSAADSGVYICTATNAVGEASTSMVVTVIQSPFDSLTWARDSVPNSPITDLKVIDGKCYAVAGERILVSNDGREWTPWMLPSGFEGMTLAKLGTKWYCSGFRMDGKHAITSSVNGIVWGAPQTLTGLDAVTASRGVAMLQLEANGDRLIGISSTNLPGTFYPDSNTIYHSTNGTTWTKALRRNADNSLTTFSTAARVLSWGGKLYLPAGTPAPSSGTNASVLTSTDGVIWQETVMPLNPGGSTTGVGTAITPYGGLLYLISEWGNFSSPDGATWTYLGTRSGSSAGNMRFAEASDGSYGFWVQSQNFYFGSSPINLTSSQIQPATSQNFTCAVSFQGAAVFGTSNGYLHRVDRRPDVTLAEGSTHSLESIVFVNDEFLAYRAVNEAQSPGPLLISGDGKTWREGRSFSTTSTETNFLTRVHMGGRYLGLKSTGTVPASGWAPSALSTTSPPAGVPDGISSAAFDGTRWLVLAAFKGCYSVTPDGLTWTKLTINGYSPKQNDTILRFNNKWFACSPQDLPFKLRQSVDGINWTTVTDVAPSHIAVLGGKLCGVTADGYTCCQSTDGVTWQNSTIAPGIGSTGTGASNVVAVRLAVFNNSLVMLARETWSDRGFLYFSNDGQNWVRTSVTSRIRDFAVGNGVFAAVTTNGGVILARSSAVQGSAPLTRITSPRHRSVHLTGSTVEISGTAIDPEGQQVTTECFVDGVSLGTVTGDTFRFSYPLTSNTGHVVTVRSRDPQNFVGSDEVLVSVNAPQLTNLLESGEGKSFVPVTSWTSFGGYAYAAGPNALYRSRGDGTWEKVALPVLPSAITNIVSGNGTLIVQTSASAFLTRDGVNWWQMNEFGNGISIGVSLIAFKDGWFISAAGPIYSRDGLSWSVGAGLPSGTTLLSPVVTPGGALLASPPYRSVDGGLNWLPIPEFTGLSVYQVQFAPAFGAVFAGVSDGRVFRSGDDGATWNLVAQFPPMPTGHQARIALHAGRLYWGGGGVWLASSADGVTWQALEGAAVASFLIEQIDGRFVGFGRAGMVFSADGVTWEAAPTAPACAAPGMLAEDGDHLLMGDTAGGLWQTQNGVDWTRLMAGKPLSLPPATIDGNAMTTIRIGNQTVVGGPGGNYGHLYYSSNTGLDWQRATYHGGPLSNTVEVQKLWTDGVTAFAHVKSMGEIEGRDPNELWRSNNGIDWTRDWSWSSGAIADMSAHGGTWLCVGTNGLLRRSTNAGMTWTTESVPGLLSARAVRRFDGVWMLIGAEVANLQGPNVVYSSSDGQSWTRLGAFPGDTGWNKVACATSETAIVVVSSSGRIYTANDHNLLWTQTGTTNNYFSNTPVIERVGAKFSIQDRLVSDDGVTWTVPTKIGSSLIATPKVNFAGVYVTFPSYRNPHWSLDGLNWTEMTGGSTSLQYKPIFAYDASTLRARDNVGAIWATTDGKSWTLAVDVPPDSTGQAYARKIVSFGPRLVAAGTSGLMLVSENDGESWQNCLLNGRTFPSGMSVGDLEKGATQVIARFIANANYSPPICRYFRSSDGVTWNEITSAVGTGVMDLVWSEGRWLAIRYDGSLIQSTDDGATWTAAGTVPGLVGGRQIARFNGLWVVAGPVASTTNAPYSLFTSPDAVTWTNRGATTFSDSSSKPGEFFSGHGLLFFGLGPESLQSSDGITWTSMGKGGNTGTSDASGYVAKWMVPVADGYLAFNFSSSKSYFWSAPVNGGAWAAVPSYQNQVSAVVSLDSSRLFLCGPGTIKEWTRADLALSLADPVAADLGVGDSLAVSVTVRNLGNESLPPGDPPVVDAWLSSDGFFGDGNDVYLGRVNLPVAAPVPGAQVSCALEYTLPDTIEPGTHHVVLRLDTQGRLDESNRSNNTALTRGAVINIPQWQLNMATFGTGEVSQTSARRFYPHKANIGLFARAGKGAAFGGWGGDAVGGLSETSVLMDGNKNVTATFISQASLRVITIGNGSVNVPASGAVAMGSQVQLTATPAAGWEFDRWEGGVTGTSSSTPLTVDDNKVVRAYFRQTKAGWKQLHFNATELAQSSISGDDADPDRDGVRNWQEFAHGSHPRDPGSNGRGTIRRDGNELVVIFTRNQNPAGGVGVACQASRALNDWGTTGLTQQVLGQANGVETIEARLPITGHNRGFMRFVYTQPAP